MDISTREKELREQFQDNQVQFLLTELEVAATFCKVAKSSADPEKIKRNVANARVAYKTALRFARGAHFDANSEREFDSRLAHLKSLLRDLGQDV
jgi:hypothetical protein